MATIEHHKFVYTLKIISDICYNNELQKKEQINLQNDWLIDKIYETFKDYDMELKRCKDI